jgi:predicted DCC family thiol-disulfide oxidoreductase YuxK
MLHIECHAFVMKIIFYDGDCGLCQRSISFLWRMDVHKQLHFAPLNGQTYLKYLKTPASMETVLYFNGSQLYNRSTAIINCLVDLGGIWKFALILKIIPLFMRDFIYNLIAVNRNKVSCLILPRDERFLN